MGVGKSKGMRTTGIVDGRQVQYGTKAQLENGHVVIEGGRGRVRRQHPLDMYFHDKRLIDAEQYWAGYRLCCYYVAAYGHRSVMASLVRGLSAGAEDRFAAKDWYDKTMAGMGRVSAKILRLVLIDGYTLPQIHEVMGWQKVNTGTDRLKEALDELSETMDALAAELSKGTLELEKWLVNRRARIR